MADATVITAVAGIVVSGVVGPTLSARMMRGADRRRFAHDDDQRRREGLLRLFDDAAAILSAGATNIRQARSAHGGVRIPEETDVTAWAHEVFAMSQRLLLWLPAEDPIVEKYQAAREQLTLVAQAPSDDEGAIEEFERRRAAFIELCRQQLNSPPPETSKHPRGR